MNNRKWRNPYAPLSKKNGQTSTGVVTPAALTLPSTKSKSSLPILDLRSSVSRMRSNIKGIGDTIRQMEETMDTLYGAMEMVDSLSRSTKSKPASTPPARGRKALPAPVHEEEEEQPSAADNNPLANIDMSQLLGLLQSPLVQSLINQQLGSTNKRKKEGS